MLSATDPRLPKKGTTSIDEETKEIATPTNKETLEVENIPDEMANEQTWPTEEELKEAEEAFKNRKKKKVPKGINSYQAAWILDEDEEGEEEEGVEEDEVEMAEDEEEGKKEVEEDEDLDRDFEEEEEDDTVFENMEGNEPPKTRAEEAAEDEQFPDEVETPIDQLAKLRFQKYRGLKSFRTSPWDPKESLPAEYSRIFQFQSYFRTRKNVMKKNAEGIEVFYKN